MSAALAPQTEHGWPALKQQAAARAQALGVPHNGLEEWLYVPTECLKHPFAPAPALHDAGALKERLVQNLPADWPGSRLVLVNGVVDEASGSPLPGGLRQQTFGGALATPEAALVAEWAVALAQEEDYFAALNLAHCPQVLHLHVPKGTVLEEPLLLVLADLFSQSGHMALPRVMLHLEREAQVSVAVAGLGWGQPGLCAPAFLVVLEEGAQLRVDEYRPSSPHAVMSGWQVTQHRDSRFDHTGVFAGAAPGRWRLALALEGQGAETHLAGLNLLEGQAQQHHLLRLRHHAPRCLSRQVFKSVLMDEARSSFDALVHVFPGAAGTDAHQLNQNLMLSHQARADANPRLEIFEDDVKCAHGATVGRLDEEEVFYLRTRGLGADQARRLLTHGFARELVATMAIPAMRQWVAGRVMDRLVSHGGSP